VLRELCAQLAQHPLDDRGVLAAHAQQQLLPARQSFEFGIGKLVKHVWSYQLNGFLHLRCIEQVIDNLDNAVVEIGVRVTEALVGLLHQRIEATIGIDHRIEVC